MSKKPQLTVVSVTEKGQCCGAKLDIKSSAGFAQCCLSFIIDL